MDIKEQIQSTESKTTKAKRYIKKLPTIQLFDNIINQIPFSQLEKNIIIGRFKNFKTVSQLSRDLHIAEPTVYQRQRTALEKIYYFLRYRKYI